MRSLAWKAIGALVVLIAAMIVWGQMKHTFERDGQTHAQVAHAKAAEARADTVYVHDTIVRSGAITAYRATIQPILLGDPTPREVKIITLADTVLQRDSVALASCNRLLAAKDTVLHAVTRRTGQPVAVPFLDALYAPQPVGTVVLRAGLTTRPFLPGHLGLVVVGETSPGPGVGSRLYVGFHTNF